jgi:hypothetical protein
MRSNTFAFSNRSIYVQVMYRFRKHALVLVRLIDPPPLFDCLNLFFTILLAPYHDPPNRQFYRLFVFLFTFLSAKESMAVLKGAGLFILQFG